MTEAAPRTFTINFGPQHPAAHGVLRLVLELDGELVTDLKDGRSFKLAPGMSYQVADDDGEHRSHTDKGARLFIVD